jgi:hypothetical protein
MYSLKELTPILKAIVTDTTGIDLEDVDKEVEDWIKEKL